MNLRMQSGLQTGGTIVQSYTVSIVEIGILIKQDDIDNKILKIYNHKHKVHVYEMAKCTKYQSAKDKLKNKETTRAF